jgi:hypothetical protein
MDTEFIQSQIEQIKALITNINAAMLALSLGRVKSFSINTGQTQESVTEQDIGYLQGVVDGLYNQLAVLEARLYGGAVSGVPGW